MPYEPQLHDHVRVMGYAKSNLDMLRAADVTEAMLSKFFGMKKHAQCPQVSVKRPQDETLLHIFGETRTFDYGLNSPRPSQITIDRKSYPRCMCQHYSDANGRKASAMFFYVFPPEDMLGQEVSEDVREFFENFPEEIRRQIPEELKKQMSGYIVTRAQRDNMSIAATMLFHGDWKHYKNSSDNAKEFSSSRNMTGQLIGCSEFAKGAGSEFCIPSDLCGFLTDQLV